MQAATGMLVPDRLVATAGDVIFKITNNMKMAHDFDVYPLGDITAFIAKREQGEEPELSTINGEMLFEDFPADKSDQKTKTLPLACGWPPASSISQNADGTSFIHRDRGQRFTFLLK